MKTVLLMAASCIIGAVFTFLFCKPDNTYYFHDGEGNEIPAYAVHLLVQNEFVFMTKAEKDTINKYFYFKNLK